MLSWESGAGRCVRAGTSSDACDPTRRDELSDDRTHGSRRQRRATPGGVPGGRRGRRVPGGHRLRALLRSRQRARGAAAVRAEGVVPPSGPRRSCSSRSPLSYRGAARPRTARERRGASAAARSRHPASAQSQPSLSAGVRPGRAGRKGGSGESGADALGLRVPAWSPALAALAAVEMPVLQSSANLSGEPDARRLLDVPQSIRAGADLVLDGGDLPGIPSTVIDLREYERRGEWQVVREGPLTRADLERILAS